MEFFIVWKICTYMYFLFSILIPIGFQKTMKDIKTAYFAHKQKKALQKMKIGKNNSYWYFNPQGYCRIIMKWSVDKFNIKNFDVEKQNNNLLLGSIFHFLLIWWCTFYIILNYGVLLSFSLVIAVHYSLRKLCW
jgi:hypothetical protein